MAVNRLYYGDNLGVPRENDMMERRKVSLAVAQTKTAAPGAAVVTSGA